MAPNAPATRIMLATTAGLVLLLGLVAAVRPEMLGMTAAMRHAVAWADYLLR